MTFLTCPSRVQGCKPSGAGATEGVSGGGGTRLSKEVKSRFTRKKEAGWQTMFREEALDAQRREPLLSWMEGEQGEDRNTGAGRDPAGPGGGICTPREGTSVGNCETRASAPP